MKLSNWTGVGRAIDPHYPTNRAIAMLIVVVALGWAVATGDGWQGVRAGLDVFFAWALCRELDPDHDLSAFLAAALALAGLALATTSTGPLFWLLLVVRVVNRTTGLGATVIDSALVLYLGLSAGCGLFTAMAFAMDALLARGRRRQWLFASVAVLASLWIPTPLPHFSLPALLIAALFLPVVQSSRRLTSLDDTHSEPLDPSRIRAGQMLALGVGLLATVGWQLLLPLWAAIAAACLWHFGSQRRAWLR